MDAIDPIEAELSGAGRLDVYHGANALWVCLVKLANLFPTSGEEHEQIAAMIRRFTRAQAAAILAEPGVDALIGLDPPLESVLAEKRERLGQSSATAELNRLRARRERDPKAAIAALFEILQRIRDKREHGFKTPSGPRDNVILRAFNAIVQGVCTTAILLLRADGDSMRTQDGATTRTRAQS